MNLIAQKLFSINGYNKPPSPATISVFAEIKALPGSQVERSVRYRNGNRMPKDGAFNVRCHVIGSFQGMLKHRCVFRDHPVKMRFKIAAD